MKSSKILLKDGQTVDLVDGRIADSDIASWNNKPNVTITSKNDSVNISTSVDAETNTKTFDLSVDSLNITSSDGSINVSTSEGVTDLTLPGDVVRDSAYTHIDAATANPLMNSNAAVGISTKYAREDHVHPSDTSKEDIANKTTVVLGTSDSKYPTDKAVANFVNSSIATNTANYISNNGEPFTSVEPLEAYSGPVTNNDYAFVTGTDSEGNTYYDRYKATVSGSSVTWALEYRLNNSSFTAAQWSAINSGITSVLVSKLEALDPTPDAEKEVFSASKLTNSRTIDGVAFDGSGDIIHYGVCSTAGNIREKVISCPGFVLTTGARIIIKFTKSNNFRDPTFNVNDTGAFPVKYFGDNLPTLEFLRNNAVYQFVYDGTNYCFVGNFDNNNFVYQSAISKNAEYPMIFKNSTSKKDENSFVHYASGITMNPSTNKITALGGFVGHLEGNAATASEAASGSALESEIASKQDALTFDSVPTAGSNNPVTSDGIKTAIDTVNKKGLTIKEISGEQVICFE